MEMSFARMKDVCRKGSNYFDKDNMEFWGSQIHSTADAHQLFIESIDDFDRTGQRLYMVKCLGMNGCIETVEPYVIAKTHMHFPTLEMAETFREAVGREIGDCKEIKSCEQDFRKIGVFKLNSGIFKFDKDGTEVLINADEVFEKCNFPPVKYHFDYRCTVVKDVHFTDEQLEGYRNGTYDIPAEIEEQFKNCNAGEIQYDGVCDIKVIDGVNNGEVTLYGRYETDIVGVTRDDCLDKMNAKFKEMDKGEFSDMTLDWVRNIERVDTDCETLIKNVVEKMDNMLVDGTPLPFDSDVFAAVNMDNSGYTLRCEVYDPLVKTVDLALHTENDPLYHKVIPVVTTETEDTFCPFGTRVGELKDVLFDKFTKLARDISLGKDITQEFIRENKNKNIERD